MEITDFDKNRKLNIYMPGLDYSIDYVKSEQFEDIINKNIKYNISYIKNNNMMYLLIDL